MAAVRNQLSARWQQLSLWTFPILPPNYLLTVLFLEWIFNMSEVKQIHQREKWRDLTQPYDKSPFINRNLKKAKWEHKKPPKRIKHRLRTVSWSNDSQQTGVVKTGLRAKPSHSMQQACNQKDTHQKKCK